MDLLFWIILKKNPIKLLDFWYNIVVGLTAFKKEDLLVLQVVHNKYCLLIEIQRDKLP